MSGIILHRRIANCYEFFNPDDDFFNHVSEDNCFAVALLECPGLLRADPPFLLGFFEGSGEYIDMASDQDYF